MRWLDISRPDCRLRCVYCEQVGDFPHAKSFEHAGDILSLYSCVRCGSLIYDLAGIEAPIVSSSDAINPDAMRAARYVLETGFSSHFVALCGLSALPDVPEQALSDYLFVDVGAGMGMASFFIKSVIGVETVTIEPSFTGALSHDILGLQVHRAYFEDLPQDVLSELARKRCLLHLNSVVEHLIDPAAVLADIVRRARIEVVAIVVPDGTMLDSNAPFSFALPFLAPRDHRHLPTRSGMEYLLRNLGFEFQLIQRTANLLLAVGSRAPVAVLNERTIRLAETLLLEHLLRHPNPQVAGGGASRLLPVAITKRDELLLPELRRRLLYEPVCDHLISLLQANAWDDIPFHLGPTCYWLAFDALSSGRPASALQLLAVCQIFADTIAETYPEMAMTPLEYKWSALLLRAHILASTGDSMAARDALDAIITSRADLRNGARQIHIEQAELRLRELLERSMVAE